MCLSLLFHGARVDMFLPFTSWWDCQYERPSLDHRPYSKRHLTQQDASLQGLWKKKTQLKPGSLLCPVMTSASLTFLQGAFWSVLAMVTVTPSQSAVFAPSCGWRTWSSVISGMGKATVVSPGMVGGLWVRKLQTNHSELSERPAWLYSYKFNPFLIQSPLNQITWWWVKIFPQFTLGVCLRLFLKTSCWGNSPRQSRWSLTIAERVALGYMDPMSRLYLPWLELGVTFWWSGPWCRPGWNQMSKKVGPLPRLSAQAGSKHWGHHLSQRLPEPLSQSLLRRKLCLNASLFLRVILSSSRFRWT